MGTRNLPYAATAAVLTGVAAVAAAALMPTPVLPTAAVPLPQSHAQVVLTDWWDDVESAAESGVQLISTVVNGGPYGGYVGSSSGGDTGSTPASPSSQAGSASPRKVVSGVDPYYPGVSGVDPYYPGVNGIYLTGVPALAYVLTDMTLHSLGGTDLDNYFFEIGAVKGGPASLIAGLRAVIYVGTAEAFGATSPIAQLAKKYFYDAVATPRKAAASVTPQSGSARAKKTSTPAAGKKAASTSERVKEPAGTGSKAPRASRGKV